MNETNYEDLEICPSSPIRWNCGLTKKYGHEVTRPAEDPRFAKPETRRPIKEDSGTYSIIRKRGGR